MNTFKNVLKLLYAKNLEAQFMMAGFVGCLVVIPIYNINMKTEHFLTESNGVQCVF